MPHDVDGREIKAGDRVTIECVVREVQPGEDYCNATLDTVIPMLPSKSPYCLTVNAGQVRKVNPGPVE